MSFGVTQYVFVLKHQRLESFSDDESQWNIVLKNHAEFLC